MDKTIKELYVSPELESLEMAMELAILQDSSNTGGEAGVDYDEVEKL